MDPIIHMDVPEAGRHEYTGWRFRRAVQAPAAISALLAAPEWCEQWADTLRTVTDTLQVAVVRLLYEHGPRHPKTRGNQQRLKQVTARLHTAQVTLTRYRRGQPEARAATVTSKTRQWVRDYHRDEWPRLLAAEYAAARIDPAPYATPLDLAAYYPWAIRHGYLDAPATSAVMVLLNIACDTFQTLVADDAKDQQDRNLLLRHPLLLHRWRVALEELHQMTVDLLGWDGLDLSGGLPVTHLLLPRGDPEEAYRSLNAARFLAAVRQRQVEQRSLDQTLRRVVSDREHGARQAAGIPALQQRVADRLQANHPGTVALFRRILSDHAYPDGRLDKAFYTAAATIKRAAFAEADQLREEQ